MGIGMLLKITQYSFSGRVVIAVNLCGKKADFGCGSNDDMSRRVTLAQKTFGVGKVVQVQVLLNSQTSRAVSPCNLLLA